MIQSQESAPALAKIIRYYYGVDVGFSPAGSVLPVPARSSLCLAFMLGVPWRMQSLSRGTIEEVHPVTLAGPRTRRHMNLLHSDGVVSFVVVFQPGGFFRLFGLPGEEATDQDIPATEAVGRLVSDLRERLAGSDSFSGRVACADEVLAARLPSARQETPISRIGMHIRALKGAVSIRALADRTGLSLRQFERRFRHEIGVPPKLYARIVRFEAALALKASGWAASWTEIAHALGYHDQMHMVHDFNSLSGDTPSGLGPRVEMFVRPEVRFAAAHGRDASGTLE